MDALILARLQFAFTVGFHFLFPAMTLGTSLGILFSETMYLVKKEEAYRKITLDGSTREERLSKDRYLTFNRIEEINN